MKSKDKKKDTAEDRMIEEFWFGARIMVEVLGLHFLTEGLIAADTKTTCSKKYWSADIKIKNNGIRFSVYKKGKIKAAVWDETHGLCRMTLIRRRDVLDDMKQALETLRKDVFFLYLVFCNDWDLLMAHLAECRDKGVLKDWKESCEVYHTVEETFMECEKMSKREEPGS